MPTYNSKDSAAWRGLLKPLVFALVTLCAAGTAYLKAHTEVSESHDLAIERMAKLEAKVESDCFRIGKVERDAEILKASLANIQSDVSYIRGKLEAAESYPVQRRR